MSEPEGANPPPLAKPKGNQVAPDATPDATLEKAPDAAPEKAPDAGREKPEDVTIEKIKIKVVDQQKNEVFFHIKITTKLGKVMHAYCDRQGLDPASVRFLHDGERIVETQTPTDRAMEDGDTIEVFLEQLGGAGSETAGIPSFHIQGFIDQTKKVAPRYELNGLQLRKVTFKVLDQQSNELHFTIKSDAKLSKVMDYFRERHGLAAGAIRFLHEGTRIQDDDTPETLQMEDGDLIQVFLEQTGGNINMTITVLDQQSNEHFFALSSNTKLSRVVNYFRDKHGLAAEMYNGNTRIQDDDTPESLHIQDGDMIPAFLEQTREISKGPKTPITIAVVNAMHVIPVKFKIRSDSKLKKLVRAYCNHQGQDRSGVVLFFGDEKIQDDDTAQSLGLKDGDTIQAFNGIIKYEIHGQGQTYEGNDTAVHALTTDTFDDAMHIYCSRFDLEFGNTKFCFDGRMVWAHETPGDCGVKGGDIIYAEKFVMKMNPCTVPTLLTLTIQDDEEDCDAFFQILSNETLDASLEQYCNLVSVRRNRAKFFFGNQEIYTYRTPEDLKMKDGDIICKLECFPLWIKDSAGRVMQHRFVETSPMKEVIESWSSNYAIPRAGIRLMYQGERVLDEETFACLLLDHGDTLDLVYEQTGGGGSEAAEGEPRPEAAEAKPKENAKLEIVLRDHVGQDISFMIKYNTKMEKVMNAYYTRMAKTPGSLRFYASDGTRINKDDTPTSLDLETGDIIDVHVEQLGGASEGFGNDSNTNIKPEDLDKALTLKAEDQDGAEVTFQVKKSIKLSKHQSQAENSVCFFTPPGKRILPTNTSAFYELGQGGIFGVHVWQEGGRL